MAGSSIDRRRFLKATATVLAGSTLSKRLPAGQKRKPNIVVILTDDMGWQDTSVPFWTQRTPLNRRYRTTALERLAKEGMKFTQAYACAVCSPTRVSLLTGLNQAHHRVTQWVYLRDQPPDLPHPTLVMPEWNCNGLQPSPGVPRSVHASTLPALLRDAGYRTIHIGKGHLGATGTPGEDPKTLGFDVRIGGRGAGGAGDYSGLKRFAAGGNTDLIWRAWDLDHYFGQDIHLTEALTREACREVRKAVPADKPFFLYFAHYAPHTPIQADERFAPKYRAAGLDEKEAAYASLIEGMDKSVSDVLDLLDELGIARNTLVLFVSDNGGVSHAYRSGTPHTHNAPLSSGKGSHREGGIRVPMLVRWPGVTKPQSVCDTPVIIYDCFPTLLRAAGVNASAIRTDGLDLTPLLRGESPGQFDRPLVWHFPNSWGPLQDPGPVEGPGMGPCSVIRHGDWKLIYYHDGPHFELFNLAVDIAEEKDLAKRKPARLRELARELGAYLRDVEAPMPIVKATDEPVPWPDDYVDSA